MLQNFTSRVMYAPARARRVDEEEEGDEEVEEGAHWGGDVDEDYQAVPQWDEMLDLVDEVDRELGL